MLNPEITDYISTFPMEVQTKLNALRRLILDTAPEAKEVMSYKMPTYVLGGNLVHFAGYAKHIGFYPTPSAIDAFKNELSPYKTSKGAVQFPLESPLPFDLIKEMVLFRVKENTR